MKPSPFAYVFTHLGRFLWRVLGSDTLQDTDSFNQDQPYHVIKTLGEEETNSAFHQPDQLSWRVRDAMKPETRATREDAVCPS